MGLCASSDVYFTNNPAHDTTCPEGALTVQPGLNSLTKAIDALISSVATDLSIGSDISYAQYEQDSSQFPTYKGRDRHTYSMQRGKISQVNTDGTYDITPETPNNLWNGVGDADEFREAHKCIKSVALKDIRNVTPKNGITGLFLLNGVHDENGECIFIEFPLKIVGQNRDAVKIKAGLWILGREGKDVHLSDCTVTGAKGNGIYAGTLVKCPGETSEEREAASILFGVHLKNVCVEKCGAGVCVDSTSGNTMTDCNVNNNTNYGVLAQSGACMTIDGSATTIHHNVGKRDKRANNYGLHASGGSILLKSLKKEDISTKNGGGGNYTDTRRLVRVGKAWRQTTTVNKTI
tara:strand:+ start:15 stop:1061 length:1047 start_codon:yes stop_codon:yes gene_type:complete